MNSDDALNLRIFHMLLQEALLQLLTLLSCLTEYRCDVAEFRLKGFLWNTSLKFLSRFAEFSKLHDLKQKFLQVNHFALEFTDMMMFQSYLKTLQFWDEQTQNSIILRLLLQMRAFFQKNVTKIVTYFLCNRNM